MQANSPVTATSESTMQLSSQMLDFRRHIPSMVLVGDSVSPGGIVLGNGEMALVGITLPMSVVEEYMRKLVPL